MMSLRLAFLSIVYSSEDGSQQRFRAVRSASDLTERRDEILPDTCHRDFECGFAEECNGSDREVRRGRDMEDREDTLPDDIDYSGLIQLEIGESAVGFPWEKLREELDKFSTHLKLIVIALQFRNVDEDRTQAQEVETTELAKFIGSEFVKLAAKTNTKNALYVFAKNPEDFEAMNLLVDYYGCHEDTNVAVQISLKKKD